VFRIIADHAGFPVISVTVLAAQRPKYTRVLHTALIDGPSSTPLTLALGPLSYLHDFNLRFEHRTRHDGLNSIPLSTQVLDMEITHLDVHLPPRSLLVRCWRDLVSHHQHVTSARSAISGNPRDHYGLMGQHRLVTFLVLQSKRENISTKLDES